MAIYGDTIVVGGNESINSAYVFERTGSTWDQTAKLIPSDFQGGDEFGSSVAIHGDWIAAGSEDDDDEGLDAGAAYLFTRTAGSWAEHQKLPATT